MSTVLRQVIKIDEELCNGCGLCVPSCAEGALQMIDGKAKMASDKYCDGLGACLGECPQGAISFEEREAEEYDQDAVVKRLESQGQGLRIKMDRPLPARLYAGRAVRSRIRHVCRRYASGRTPG